MRIGAIEILVLKNFWSLTYSVDTIYGNSTKLKWLNVPQIYPEARFLQIVGRSLLTTKSILTN